jgi:two-component system chemotaxis sensor kinase CheA
MTFNAEELREILTIYKAESEEHLQKLNECLLLMEKDPKGMDLLDEVFREAHSLKGSARMIGFQAVERVAHSLEDLFAAVRKQEVALQAAAFDAIFESLDTIQRVTEKWLEDPEAEMEDVSALTTKLESLCRPDAGVSSKGSGPSKGEEEADAVKAESRKGRKKKDDATEDAAQGRKKGGKKRSAVAEDIGGQEGGAAVKECPPGESVRFEVEETIRVTTHKLDDLMNRIGEILVTKIKFDQRLAEVRRLGNELDDIHRSWGNTQRQLELQDISRSEETMERLAQIQQETGGKLAQLHDDFGDFLTSFTEDSLRMTLISSELQESINRVRMLPLSSLFNTFPRLLRDMAKREGKEVELRMEGEGIQLDKKILEQLKDPMMHLLRNALDHGVEKVEDRDESGKGRTGTILLKATQHANSVLIEVHDDGAGMDVEKIRSIALRRGFVTEEALEEMTEQQVLALVFRPGFSTKGIITDLSGRGVGLDVVFNVIEKLKGSISLSSEVGGGTCFSIKLPVSLATSQALVVRVNEQVFAIPLTAVDIITEVGLDEVMTVESREAVLVEEMPTALVRLHEVLSLPTESIHLSDDEKAPVVVIGSADERVALMVNEVIGEKEIVVKGLGPQLRRVRNLSGATILGDGSVVLILNVFDLIKSSQKVRGMWVTSEKKRDDEDTKRPEILVADDSVTTRVLEKNILEGSGYHVTLAVDGRDALEKAREGGFDLVVSDVEMPRMSGFELAAELRSEERFNDLPIILVTSLDSEEDKRKGIEAGADAYITKGAFEQGNLLSTIKQLL